MVAQLPVLLALCAPCSPCFLKLPLTKIKKHLSLHVVVAQLSVLFVLCAPCSPCFLKLPLTKIQKHLSLALLLHSCKNKKAFVPGIASAQLQGSTDEAIWHTSLLKPMRRAASHATLHVCHSVTPLCSTCTTVTLIMFYTWTCTPQPALCEMLLCMACLVCRRRAPVLWSASAP